MNAPHTRLLFGDHSGRLCRPEAPSPGPVPLLVALHGGTYTSAYFDVPGCSLLARAAANGLPAIAPDRPGYGRTPALPAGQATIATQARRLQHTLKQAWQQHGAGTRGIVLVAHSIGAAIAATLAANVAREGDDDLPLIGLALSGVGLRTPPAFKPLWDSLPDTPTVEMPPGVKDTVMFGPAGSFDPAMPATTAAAGSPAPKAELVDIVSTWHETVHATLADIRVPVHYRQAEVDRLWIVDDGEVDGFARALSASPRVDAALMRGTGHCIDFHHVGAAFQLQQLGFVLQCAAECAADTAR